MNPTKKEFHESSRDRAPKEHVCQECGKSFSKSSSFYNHRKLQHNFKPRKDNERGRPVKSDAKPFDRNLLEIFKNPRKAMQDRYFPELAKVLLKIVRKDKDCYDKVFDSLDKFDRDFGAFVRRSMLLSEEWPGIDFLDEGVQEEIKLFFRILLENWRLTLKLTDAFCKELALIIGYFVVSFRKPKEEIAHELKTSQSLEIIVNQGLNNVCETDFLEQFLEILSNWKNNYKL